MKYLDMAIAAVTGFCFGWLLRYTREEKEKTYIYPNFMEGVREL